MTRFSLIIVLSVVLFGCQSTINRKGIIREPVFINLLADIHLADGIIAVKGYRIVADSAQIADIYNAVFEKYEVTQHNFKTTLDYYAQNSLKYDKMYDKVLERLSVMESQLNPPTAPTDQ